MIKVPGTAAGLPAIEELTRRGVNVNITLLFSVERYEQVIDAYLRGLTARADAGEPVDQIASVASFFLSRIDTKADALLDPGLAAARPGSRSPAPASPTSVTGPSSPAPAGSGWPRLGARPQRPLWASTGNQEPRLLGRALRLGADRPRRDQHDARAHAARVRRSRRGRAHARRRPGRRRAHPRRRRRRPGSTSAAITAQLEREGVRSFCDSYHQLLDCIERKLTAGAAGNRARAPGRPAPATLDVPPAPDGQGGHPGDGEQAAEEHRPGVPDGARPP